ncbi:signal peptide protein [Paenibacillus sp. BAC0078]
MNKGRERRTGGRRLARIGAVLSMLLMAVLLLSACSGNSNSVFHTDTETTDSVSRVPWDYRVVEGTVGDLIGSDMTVLPDNEMLPNDGNYATGDKIWTLQFMDAELVTDADQKNDIRLSSWSTIKSYGDQKSAIADLKNLKVSITTDVDLVGVYKTKYKNKTRNFAVIELPSGNRIKQPIDDNRYKALEKQKKASVVLEEVHDFADYDSAYAKFRGWAK